MKISLVKFSSIIIAILCYTSCYAQSAFKTLADFTKEKDEIFLRNVFVDSDIKKVLKREIKEGLVTPENLTPLKIGLITTYLYEEKYIFPKSHILYLHSNTDGGSPYFVEKITLPSIKGLKDALIDNGFQLLEPSEFLSSAEIKDYKDLAEKTNRVNDLFVRTVKEAKLSPAPSGYEFIYSMALDGRSGKVSDNFGEFARKMGLDAVLSLEIGTVYQKKTIYLSQVIISMHSWVKDNQGKYKSLLMNIYQFSPDFYYPIIGIVNGKAAHENLVGFEELANRIGKDYCSYINESIKSAF